MMNEWIISSSVLILLVLLGRLLLRGKISLRLQYALWALVLVRLLVPMQLFTSSFGTGFIAREVDIAAPVRDVYVSANEDRYEREYDAAYQQVLAQYQAASRPVDPIVIERESAALAKTTLELDLRQLLLKLWLAGMAVMAAVIVSCNLHLSMKLRRRRWEYPAADSLLPVYVTEAVPTPCIFGLFRPAVYLTPQAARDDRIRTHVLAHELTHYRHGDYIWSVLRSLCLVLHWYNPLVWIAAKVSRADAELACDEGTLARLGESQRGDYGRTLIGLTCCAPISELLLTATTMTGSGGSIRERIKLLMERPRNTVLTVTTVILLVTLIVGCTFSAAPETTPPATEPMETTSPPKPDLPPETAPGVDNDMAYTDQDLPIPDVPTDTDLTYALPMEQAMADYADKNPRELNEKELKEFRAAFSALDENGNANPAACFLYPYYDDITEMDGGEFLAYFPTDQEGTKEEFALLKAKYPDFFGEWTFETMPIPIHRYEASVIEAVVSRFGNIHWPELDGGVHYLEETGCYYNYTSDFGLGGFYAREGFVFDGGAVVYSDFSALFFTETAGSYTIQAHLPAIEPTTHSSHPMIPADYPDAEITALVTAFNRAYQENLYMGTDNPYDHLTVLALDPEITVTWEGKPVPLSEFHKNIQFLHDKQTWYQHTRSYGEETPEEYAMTCQVSSIQYDGDTAIVVTTGGVQFTDDDPAAPRGEGAVHKFLLVRVDDIWLVADVFSEGESFDRMYKNNPDFDVEKLISN